MDEIHFISDPSRGAVWEDTIILLDPSVQLIGLSATIDNPESFAKWISNTRCRPISLIKRYERPVPLEYAIYDGIKVRIVLDAAGSYDSNEWRTAERNLSELDAYHRKNKTDKQSDLLLKFVEYADTQNLMQLCFIVFSKKNCERYAEKINRSLLTSAESIDAVQCLETKLGSKLKAQELMPRFQQIKRLVQKGICFHHAGMPVILKEVVEHLYKSSKIKVLFATETVAIGVNMPVRTIVYTSLEKASGSSEDGQGSSIRYINAAEFKQICGRAGRRGKDTIGTVVFLPLYDTPNEQIVKSELLYGPMPQIKSNMKIGYHSYLKTRVSNIDRDRYFNKTLLQLDHSRMTEFIRLEIIDLQKQLLAAQSNLNTDTRAVPDYDMKIIRSAARKTNNPNAIGNMALKLTTAQKKQVEYERKVLSNPKYKPVINNEKKIAELLDAINKKTTELEYYTLYRDDRFGSIEEFLMRMEYIDSQRNVTPYGLMVSSINDCNPFILAEIFTSGILQNMEIRDIIIYCSILTDPIVSSNKIERTPSMIDGMKVSELVKQGVHFIAGRIEAYKAAEKDIGTGIESNEAYWDISLDYIELTSLWCDIDLNIEDHSRILQKLTDLDEYEGSFIKNMLKLNTIVKNLISITDLMLNFELLPKLEQAEQILVKGIVNTDSLHVMV